VSLQGRHGVPVSFGMALWERYNRLVLTHCSGMPVLVTRYADLVADAASWSESTRAFLARQGMRLSPVPDAADTTARDFIDPGLRHSAHTRADLAGAPAGTVELDDALDSVVGPHDSFVAPDLPPEPADVARELDTVGPDTELAWHPPSWAAEDGPGRSQEIEGMP
jgi:hypothetical protein